MVFNENNVITFLRGDDDAILVALQDGAVFEAGDKVFFSLKANKNDDVDVMQVECTNFVEHNDLASSAALINIDHDDTIDLDHGTYYYDILIQWANDTYVTVVPPTKFKLAPGGSHDV